MTFKQKKFLPTEPLPDALRRFRDALAATGAAQALRGETIPVHDALGRVTATAVAARISSPSYHAAAMDGYAVRFLDTFGASETRPRRLRLLSQAIAIDTGDPMPDGFDAVIMIEDTEPLSDDAIEILKAATPWQHVRLVGEDIVATELIVSENHPLRPIDLAALLASGHTDVSVRRRPRLTVIPTGSELTPPGSDPQKGCIIDFNSTMLAAMAVECGALADRHEIVRDDAAMLKRAVLAAVEQSDIVLVNAGSSAGREDFSSDVLSDVGVVLVHGVAIKPGKPVILAIVNGKPVIGIPGYPVSAALTFNLFVRPLIHEMLGQPAPMPETITARLSRQVASSLGQEEFIRVKVGRVGEHLIATPVGRGAGALMSLARADGIMRVPAGHEGAGAGIDVTIELLRSPRSIENTLVCIGSHDNALDLLANFLKKRHPEFSLSSAHVGSMGGLLALKRGEAHCAGTHLLDEDTGEYNVGSLRRFLPDTDVVLINLVHRTQGFLIPVGNPKKISGFEDLMRSDVVFVNRQAGAGTRLLTDLHLKQLKIDPSRVKGYHHEEFTHMAVAAAVLSGAADTGLGVLSAARALGLDFVPVAQERYDLAIPQQFLDLPMMRAMLDIIRNDREFRDAILSMGGYDVSDMGRTMGRAEG